MCTTTQTTVPSRTEALQGARSVWVTVQGHEVHARVQGPDSGPVAVLLPGTSFEAATWETVGTLSTLADLGYRTIAVDPPGHGPTERVTIDADSWMADLFGGLGLTSAVVIAASLSGRLALPFVIDQPERVDAFVAVGLAGMEKHLRRLGRISAPVLTVWGGRDRTVPASRAELLVSGVRRVKRVEIEGAGHAPHVQDPDAFHAELVPFLLRAADDDDWMRPAQRAAASPPKAGLTETLDESSRVPVRRW